MDEFNLSPDEHHYLGIEMNQQVWRLLAAKERDPKDDRRMENFARSSLYHWHRSPKFKPVNAQRGHWLLSRVFAALERGQDALRHAELCMALTVELDLRDFDLAYAHETLARSNAAAGNTEAALAAHGKAVTAGEQIPAETDRKYFASDLSDGPWYGVSV